MNCLRSVCNCRINRLYSIEDTKFSIPFNIPWNNEEKEKILVFLIHKLALYVTKDNDLQTLLIISEWCKSIALEIFETEEISDSNKLAAIIELCQSLLSSALMILKTFQENQTTFEIDLMQKLRRRTFEVATVLIHVANELEDDESVFLATKFKESFPSIFKSNDAFSTLALRRKQNDRKPQRKKLRGIHSRNSFIDANLPFRGHDTFADLEDWIVFDPNKIYEPQENEKILDKQALK
jgi:hypothetical protein